MSKSKASREKELKARKKAQASVILSPFQASILQKNPKVTFDLNPSVRMSDVFDDFATPFYRSVETDLKEVNKVFGLAMVAWNLSLTDGELSDQLAIELFYDLPQDQFCTIIPILRDMIAHKHAHFSHVSRLITKFNFDGQKLQVAHHEYEPK